jgi:hypothetical protein
VFEAASDNELVIGCAVQSVVRVPRSSTRWVLPLAAEKAAAKKNLRVVTDAVEDNDVRSLLVGQQRLT